MNLFLILFLICLFLFGLQYYLKHNVDYYDFGNTDAKYRLCLLTGVHGNEPAGNYTMNLLIKNKYFEKKALEHNIFIRVIPNVNKYGLAIGWRWHPNVLHPDINRSFGDGTSSTYIGQQMLNLTKGFAMIIDFHEGWGFHLENENSVGSTLTPSSTSASEKLCEIAKDKLNKDITEPHKKFVVRYNKSCSIKSTFGCCNQKLNNNYILVETTGQDNKQELAVRAKQIKTIIDCAIIL